MSNDNFVNVQTYNINSIPLVVLSVKSTPTTQAEFDEYSNMLQNIFNWKTRFYILFDIRNITSLPKMDFVYQQVQFMKNTEHLSKQYIIKVGVVVGNIVAKYLIELLFMLREPVCPTIICDDVNEFFSTISNSNESIY